MLSSFLRGLAYLKSGFSLIRTPGLRRYVLVPLLINVMVLVLLTWFASGWLDGFMSSINWLNADSDSWTGWLVGKFRSLLWIAFAIMALIVFTYTFSLLANFLAAPFNSLLAEKVEMHLRGHQGITSNESMTDIIKRVPKVLLSETAKILYLLKWIIPLMLIYFVPIINIFAPIISFLFGAWILSLEYIDYPMSNHGLLFRQIKKNLRQKRNLALGFGSAVTLLTAVPVLNLVAMPVAVAGASKLWVEEFSKSDTKESAS